jgi:hypothetical protein
MRAQSVGPHNSGSQVRATLLHSHIFSARTTRSIVMAANIRPVGVTYVGPSSSQPTSFTNRQPHSGSQSLTQWGAIPKRHTPLRT